MAECRLRLQIRCRLHGSGTNPGQGRSVLAVHSRTSPQRKPRRAAECAAISHSTSVGRRRPAQRAQASPPTSSRAWRSAAGHAGRLAEVASASPRHWPTPIWSTWRGPRLPSPSRLALQPVPALGQPELRTVVAAVVDEFDVLRPVDRLRIDLEFGHSTSCAALLHVEGETAGGEPSSQRPAGTSTGSRGLRRHGQRSLSGRPSVCAIVTNCSPRRSS